MDIKPSAVAVLKMYGVEAADLDLADPFDITIAEMAESYATLQESGTRNRDELVKALTNSVGYHDFGFPDGLSASRQVQGIDNTIRAASTIGIVLASACQRWAEAHTS